MCLKHSSTVELEGLGLVLGFGLAESPLSSMDYTRTIVIVIADNSPGIWRWG